MAIKLSAKRLSTLQGQQGILAEIPMERTLGNTITFEGVPSLRVLLVDKIGSFPLTDELVAISAQIDMHNYEDRGKQNEWLANAVQKIEKPEAVAALANRRTETLNTTMVRLPWQTLEAALPMMEERTLAHVVDVCTGSGYGYNQIPEDKVRARYLSAWIQRDPDISYGTKRYCSQIVRFCAKHRPGWTPAFIHMVNTRMLKYLDEYQHSSESVERILGEMGPFVKVKTSGLHIDVDMHDPLTFLSSPPAWVTTEEE
jgi:hypothetical protein